MGRMRGIEMPEPSSGSALGPIGAALVGAFTSRKNAVRELETQKELMMHGKILDVAGHVAKTELGGDASSRSLQRHFDRMFGADPESQFKSKKAQKAAEKHITDVGIRGFTPGGKIEMQSVGRVLQTGGPNADKAKTRGGGKNKPAGGGGKGKGAPAGQPPAPGSGNPAMQYARGSGTPTSPTVNETATPVKPASTGNRKPRASKGGYTPRAPKERPGSYKDTSAAVKGGHITTLDAIQISPTFARKYASKVEGSMMEGENK